MSTQHLTPTQLDDISNFLFKLSQLSRTYAVVMFNPDGYTQLEFLNGDATGLKISDWLGLEDDGGYQAVLS